jgi:hypothetical protein
MWISTIFYTLRSWREGLVRLGRRALNQARYRMWLHLVEAAAQALETHRAAMGRHEIALVWVLICASRVDPASIPEDLEVAVWSFVDPFYADVPHPAWVRYMGDFRPDQPSTLCAMAETGDSCPV